MTIYLDKKRTTIHIDGQPSIQKSSERKSRQARLEKDLKKLKEQVEGLCQKKHGSPAKLFRKCRDLYRPPRSAIDAIAEGLKDLGWNVCSCPYQADTHIGELCRDEPDKSNLAVITADSDLIVYDGVPNVTMPVGRSHELTTFTKSALLQELKLPSSHHLQLAAVVTKNDYFPGLESFGIRTNANLVCGIDMHQVNQGKATVRQLKSRFHDAIEVYLGLIKSDKGKSIENVTTTDYDNAISAFVLCREDSSSSAVRSPQTDSAIRSLLRQLEDIRLRRKMLSQARVSSNMASSSSDRLVPMTQPSQDRPTASQTSSNMASSSSGGLVAMTQPLQDKPAASQPVSCYQKQDESLPHRRQGLVKKKRMARWKRAR